jgi:hypothetical protein
MVLQGGGVGYREKFYGEIFPGIKMSDENTNSESQESQEKERENFIQAVRNDEYAEYELKEDLVVITDWEGYGSFWPYVVDSEDQYNEEQVSNALTEQDVFEFEEIEKDEDQGFPCFHIHSPEFLHWEDEDE